ncbi:alpha/beta hydrolase [Archangium lipolyticum]|uniref:alpha/beta hydrolase n=1 Tax=Archangium lipolyticum TaxID=2970465 RepID=UPI00214A42D7|nr:alpha/beta hydrolase [Archangium lipolyticum]
MRFSGSGLTRWLVRVGSGLLLAGCGQAMAAELSTPTDDTGRPLAEKRAPAGFEPAPCWFMLAPDQVEGETVRCGYVAVPERHAQPDGRWIRLAVAIFGAPGEAKAKDPVVLLTGGPGLRLAQLEKPLTRERVEALASERQLIVFDQRGVGGSQPALECWEVGMPYPDPLRRCGDRLRGQGIDVTAYNTQESAEDVEAIRLALGLQHINLRGSAYGSRLALEVLRRAPERVRSVIIDSVLPPRDNLYLQAVPGFDRSLRRVFEACAADAACDARYPELEQVFSEVVRSLNASPLDVRFETPEGRPGRLRVDGAVFIQFLSGFLQDPAILETIPAMLHGVMEGRTALLGNAIGASPMLTSFMRLSYGMHLSTLCREEVSATSPAAVSAGAAGTLPELQGFFLPTQLGMFSTCAQWPSGAADPSWYEPVVSRVPTLLLSGEFDPVTPPALGSAAEQTLERGHHVVIAGGAHAVLDTNTCAADIAREFLRKPTVRPDTSCAAASHIEFLVEPPATAVP